MLRFVAASVCGVVFTAAALFLNSPPAQADAPGDPPPFLKIMEDNFSGKKNIHRALKRAVDADPTDWAEVDKLMKQYGDAAGFIGKHAKSKPEKGDEKSWGKLTAQFAAEAKELQTAVAKKDKEAAKNTLAKLNETCEACHENHR
ncbi:MAG TPA: cytochrome c [Gemmataceae bacterium]|nr:cytochrome c [Gemmataceae bacterium]